MRHKYFVFSANLNKTSFVKIFLARKTTHGHNHNANVATMHFQMFGMVTRFGDEKLDIVHHLSSMDPWNHKS
jgi:hypothetical protein